MSNAYISKLLDITKMDKCFEFGYKTAIENLDKINKMQIFVDEKYKKMLKNY